MPSILGRLREDWPSHLGLIASAAFSGLVVLRLLVFANFNPTTATGILQAGGTANVAVASVITSIPVAASLAYGWLVALLVLRWADLDKSDRFVVAGMAIGGVTVYLVFLPLVSAVLPFVAIFVLIAIGRGVRTRSEKSNKQTPDAQPSVLALRSVGALVAICIVLGLSAPPWLPHERLQIGVDGDPYTGYVIGTRGGETIIKPSGSRLLTQASTEDLTRSYCEPRRGRWEQTILQLFGAGFEHYPACPDKAAP